MESYEERSASIFRERKEGQQNGIMNLPKGEYRKWKNILTRNQYQTSGLPYASPYLTTS